MEIIARRRVYHHPFHRLYDPDAHVRSKRSVYLVGAAAIHFTMLLSLFFPFLSRFLAGGESLFSFIVEGYFLSLAFYLRGLWMGDEMQSQFSEKLAITLGFLFVIEVPIALLIALESLKDMAS